MKNRLFQNKSGLNINHGDKKITCVTDRGSVHDYVMPNCASVIGLIVSHARLHLHQITFLDSFSGFRAAHRHARLLERTCSLVTGQEARSSLDCWNSKTQTIRTRTRRRVNAGKSAPCLRHCYYKCGEIETSLQEPGQARPGQARPDQPWEAVTDRTPRVIRLMTTACWSNRLLLAGHE